MRVHASSDGARTFAHMLDFESPGAKVWNGTGNNGTAAGYSSLVTLPQRGQLGLAWETSGPGASCIGSRCRVVFSTFDTRWLDDHRGGKPRQQQPTCPTKPLAGSAVAPVEVFAFDPPLNKSDWMQMDWDRITTLALFVPWPPPADLYCHAHSRGIKIVHCIDFHATGIANPSMRSAWVAQHVAEALQFGTDGVNVDIEGFRGQKADLNALIEELYTRFKKAIPAAQITFDTDIFPRDEPGYDYRTLAKSLDFFVPMFYDMALPPQHLANSPYDGLAKSVAQYRGYGIGQERLVFALPWHGYSFPCASASLGTECEPDCAVPRKTCPEVQYAQAVQTLRNRSFAARKDLWSLDTASESVYFEYLDDNHTRHQLWFDDEVSLAAKYRRCRALGARGVGMWTAGSLEYGTTPAGQKRTAKMWRALREFTANNGTLSPSRMSDSATDDA